MTVESVTVEYAFVLIKGTLYKCILLLSLFCDTVTDC